MTKEQLQRRLVLLSEQVQGLDEKLTKLGVSNKVVDKYLADILILTDVSDIRPETVFITNEEAAIKDLTSFIGKERAAAAIQQLKESGRILVNYYSTDCDGCSTAGSGEFSNVNDLIRWIDNKYEWADGPWSWEITTPENKQEYIAPRGYWGM